MLYNFLSSMSLDHCCRVMWIFLYLWIYKAFCTLEDLKWQTAATRIFEWRWTVIFEFSAASTYASPFSIKEDSRQSPQKRGCCLDKDFEPQLLQQCYSRRTYSWASDQHLHREELLSLESPRCSSMAEKSCSSGDRCCWQSRSRKRWRRNRQLGYCSAGGFFSKSKRVSILLSEITLGCFIFSCIVLASLLWF